MRLFFYLLFQMLLILIPLSLLVLLILKLQKKNKKYNIDTDPILQYSFFNPILYALNIRPEIVGQKKYLAYFQIVIGISVFFLGVVLSFYFKNIIIFFVGLLFSGSMIIKSVKYIKK